MCIRDSLNRPHIASKYIDYILDNTDIKVIYYGHDPVSYTHLDVYKRQYQENGSMVYSGKFQGKQSHFTVSEKKTVMFQWGDMVYGPYTAKEDPAAIPKDDEFAEGLSLIHIQMCIRDSFVTVFMYLDEVPEGQTRDDLAMIIEEVLIQRMQGVKNEKGVWITPAFPKLIYVPVSYTHLPLCSA